MQTGELPKDALDDMSEVHQVHTGITFGRVATLWFK